MRDDDALLNGRYRIGTLLGEGAVGTVWRAWDDVLQRDVAVKLIAPALATITIVDPLVGIAIGVAWLGEKLDSSPPVLVGEAISAVVVIAGIAVLAHRGTQLRHVIEDQLQTGDQTGTAPPSAG